MAPKKLGFTAGQRLDNKADIQKLFQEGAQRVISGPFVTLFVPNTQPQARLCVAIGRKKVNSAVTRNRIKRQVKESFRLNQKKLVGFDFFTFARYPVNLERKGISVLMTHWGKVAKYCGGLSLS